MPHLRRLLNSPGAAPPSVSSGRFASVVLPEGGDTALLDGEPVEHSSVPKRLAELAEAGVVADVSPDPDLDVVAVKWRSADGGLVDGPDAGASIVEFRPAGSPVARVTSVDMWRWASTPRWRRWLSGMRRPDVAAVEAAADTVRAANFRAGLARWAIGVSGDDSLLHRIGRRLDEARFLADSGKLSADDEVWLAATREGVFARVADAVTDGRIRLDGGVNGHGRRLLGEPVAYDRMMFHEALIELDRLVESGRGV